MSILRYRLNVTNGKDFDEILYLTSAHLFPSPINTKLLYTYGTALEAAIELVVVGYQDDINGSWGPKGFNMCMKDVEFEDNENPMLIHDDAEQIVEHLISMGWEVRN